jgi:hypothetical protein
MDAASGNVCGRDSLKAVDPSGGEAGGKVFPCAVSAGVACQYAAFPLVAVFNPEGRAGCSRCTAIRQLETKCVGRLARMRPALPSYRRQGIKLPFSYTCGKKK